MSSERECELVHFIKNQLSIILGFAELVLEEHDVGAIRREDVVEIRNAALAALDRVPELTSGGPQGASRRPTGRS